MSQECQKCHGAAQSYLCRLCMTELRQQLLRLPTLIDHLRDTALGLTRMSNEQSRSLGFESRTPTFDDRASALITQIEDTIGGWARGTARTYGLMISPPVTWHRPWDAYVHTSTDFAMFLAANVERLARDPDIGELCESLRGYVRRAVGGREEGGLLNRRTPPRFCGPCPAEITDHRRCKHPPEGSCVYRAHECATALMATVGVVEVTCPSCGAVHSTERLRINLLARADYHRGTIPEVYDVMWQLGERVKLNTLYHWANPKRGKLKPAGYLRADGRRIAPTRHSDKDTPVYLVSDVRRMREEKLRPDHRGPALKSEGSKR